jgi:uncharacterized protein (DUF58 family)
MAAPAREEKFIYAVKVCEHITHIKKSKPMAAIFRDLDRTRRHSLLRSASSQLTPVLVLRVTFLVQSGNAPVRGMFRRLTRRARAIATPERSAGVQ